MDLSTPIAALFADVDVTDVVINGCESVWIDRGKGLAQVLSPFATDQQVQAEAVRLAALARRRLDASAPMADGVVQGQAGIGVRFHAVLPPLADAPTISLRRLSFGEFGLARLVAGGSISKTAETGIRALIDRGANCLIAGGTGAGKTTVLGAVLGEVPTSQRIICIEEVSELRPRHPHVVSLREREANIQGVGRVEMSELVRAAMRMRPDRIVIGECRGPEVMQMLTAMNTGHRGCWASLHANSVAAIPARLAALGALAGAGSETVATQAGAALDAAIFVARRGEKRWVEQIGIVVRDVRDPKNWRIEPALRVSCDGKEQIDPSGWVKILGEQS